MPAKKRTRSRKKKPAGSEGEGEEMTVAEGTAFSKKPLSGKKKKKATATKKKKKPTKKKTVKKKAPKKVAPVSDVEEDEEFELHDEVADEALIAPDKPSADDEDEADENMEEESDDEKEDMAEDDMDEEEDDEQMSDEDFFEDDDDLDPISLELLDEEDMITVSHDEPAADDKKASARKKVAPAKKRSSKATIDKELTEIYENADGSMPNMRQFQKKKRGRVLRALFTLLFSVGLLAGVAWVGFFVWAPSQSFSEEDIVLSISGEETVQAGQEVRYRIRYRNAQGKALSDVVLEVRYPDGFTFNESSREPAEDTNNRWELGALNEYDSGYIDVYGVMYGDVDSEQSFRTFLNYTPENFSSPFQKAAHTVITVSSSPIVAAVAGPEDVFAGGDVSLTFTLSQEMPDVVQEHVALLLDIPAGFVVKSSEPEQDALNPGRWLIDALGEDDVTVTIVGSYAGEDDTLSLPYSVVGWADGDRSGDGFILASDTYSASVTETELSASLAINGTVKSLTLQPGERLNASISLKNNAATDLDSLRVRAIFDAPSFDNKSILRWADLEDEADGNVFGEQLTEDMRRGVITWNKTNIDGLRVLEGGDEVLIDFGMPVKTSDDITLSDFSTFAGTVTLEVQYDINGEQQLFTSKPLDLIFNSDVAFSVSDDVSDVDGKDVHTVTWQLTNSFHELKDIVATVDIYGDISFSIDDATVPAGELTYDAESQQLVWRVESMPIAVDVLALQFPITLNTNNPSQTNLTSKVQFEAMDTVSGEQILKVGDEVLLNPLDLPVEAGL